MKKQITSFCLLSTLLLGFTACSSDDNTPIEQVNPYEKFKGTWVGTFSGDTEGGTWTATFDAQGYATGTLSTDGYTFDLEGQVSENGTIDAEYTNGTTLVGKMNGTMTATTASGTWESPLLGIQGTWTGAKN